MIFNGSHHYASLLSKEVGSKISSHTEPYKVTKVTDPKSFLLSQGFILVEDDKDEECIEQIYIKKQPNHPNKYAQQQRVFFIKFHDELTGSAFFSQRDLPIED